MQDLILKIASKDPGFRRELIAAINKKKLYIYFVEDSRRNLEREIKRFGIPYTKSRVGQEGQGNRFREAKNLIKIETTSPANIRDLEKMGKQKGFVYGSGKTENQALKKAERAFETYLEWGRSYTEAENTPGY